MRQANNEKIVKMAIIIRLQVKIELDFSNIEHTNPKEISQICRLPYEKTIRHNVVTNFKFLKENGFFLHRRFFLFLLLSRM
jgi:hypothetical protein